MLAAGATMDPSWKTSMLTHMEAGKVIEAESIFGSAYRMGQELGQPTPVMNRAQILCKRKSDAPAWRASPTGAPSPNRAG